jgi:hypothetical protein
MLLFGLLRKAFTAHHHGLQSADYQCGFSASYPGISYSRHHNKQIEARW